MEYNLTKDAEYLLCVLYTQYKKKRENKVNKAKAKEMGSSENIFTTLLSEWTYEDVDETCSELSRNDLLFCDYRDNRVAYTRLEDSAIFYMENRFKKGVSEVLNFMAQIKTTLF